MFIWVADMYLKKIGLKLSGDSVEFTSNGVLLRNLELNTKKINKIVFKQKPFGIVDSHIETVTLQLSNVSVDGVSIWIDERSPETIAEKREKVMPKVTGKNYSDLINLIRTIVSDLVNQFNANFTNLSIVFRHLGLTVRIDAVNIWYQNIIVSNITTDPPLVIIDKLQVNQEMALVVDTAKLTMPAPELIARLKSGSGGGGGESIPFTLSIINLEFAMGNNLLWRGSNIVCHGKNKFTFDSLILESDLFERICLHAKKGEITLFSIPPEKIPTPTTAESELFTTTNIVYANIAKPHTLKPRGIIHNYIRHKLWPSIINIQINTLLVQDLQMYLPMIKKVIPQKNGSGDNSRRIQISVNNIDMYSCYGLDAIHGIKTSFYIDKIYAIVVSKYLIGTDQDTHITDPLLVYHRQLQIGGAWVSMIEVSIDKIIKFFTPKKKHHLAVSEMSRVDTLVQSMFRSHPDLTENYGNQSVSWLAQSIFIINCDSLIAHYHINSTSLERTVSGIQKMGQFIFETKKVELFNSVRGELFLTAARLVCNDVITFNSLRWNWGDKHDFSIDTIAATLRPHDLSELFPKELKKELKVFRGSQPLTNYFESAALQKLARNQKDREAELQKLDSIKIIADYHIRLKECNTKFIKLTEKSSVFGHLSVRLIQIQFIQKTGGVDNISVDVNGLGIRLGKQLAVKIPELKIRDFVDGSRWSNIMSTKDMIISFVGGSLDVRTPNKIYLNLDKRAIKFINSYSKDTKISKGRSMLRRIFTSKLEIIFSVRSKISLKNTKIKISPLRVEGPNLSEKILMRLLLDNDKFAILLQGIKPLGPFVRIVRDGLKILNIKDPSFTVSERINKFLHTSAVEVLEIVSAIGNLPESERKKISVYADQPLTTKDGIISAKKEFIEGMNAILNLLRNRSSVGVIDIPLIFIRPFTNSISKIMLGILNEIDEDHREIAIHKY